MDSTSVIVFAYFLFLAVALSMLAKYFGFATWQCCLFGGVGGFLGMMLTVFVLANIGDWFGRGSPPDKKD